VRYIDLEFDEAVKVRWSEGVDKHRKPGQRFTGDALDGLFKNLIDAYNIAIVLENQGAELPRFVTTFRNMALTLQKRRNELERPAIH